MASNQWPVGKNTLISSPAHIQKGFYCFISVLIWNTAQVVKYSLSAAHYMPFCYNIFEWIWRTVFTSPLWQSNLLLYDVFVRVLKGAQVDISFVCLRKVLMKNGTQSVFLIWLFYFILCFLFKRLEWRREVWVSCSCVDGDTITTCMIYL